MPASGGEHGAGTDQDLFGKFANITYFQNLASAGFRGYAPECVDAPRSLEQVGGCDDRDAAAIDADDDGAVGGGRCGAASPGGRDAGDHRGGARAERLDRLGATRARLRRSSEYGRG